MTLTLEDPVTALEGVGAKLAGRLRDGLGITTIRDLLEHYPRTYNDAGEVVDLSDVDEGDPATMIGEVLDWSVRTIPPKGARRRPLILAEGQVRQASGSVFTVTFFNQRWRPGQLPAGTVAAFRGTIKKFRTTYQLTTPDVQILGTVGVDVDARSAHERLAHQRLLAVYPAVEGLTSFRLNELVEAALNDIAPLEDWLPEQLRSKHGLLGLDAAVRAVHRPADHSERERARHRLAFDELFSMQLGLQWRRLRLEAETVGLDNGPREAGAAEQFLDALPFTPTGAQQRAFAEIGDDLAATRPMHRLLQGDVGAGKTIVALWAMLNAVDHGRQAALMVPTEVLADQHARTLLALLEPLGVNMFDGLRVEVLTSSTPVTSRRRILGELLSGEVDLIVGTHALLEEGVRFADLGVVVIDEQHRFGVSQRVQLKEKTAGTTTGTPTTPDVLVMTATPIPRSLALTLFGDLDVTVLDELPPGREPITTQLITPAQHGRRERLYEFVRNEAAEGRQTYVVCPFVEESTTPGVAAIEEHRRLSEEIFPDLEVALVHGRLPAGAKDEAMRAFRDRQAQVLVATTVIEVGVDVPHATIMIIEDAERFGISQLHQLRGRVGRGGDRSFCVLFAGWSQPLSPDSLPRLEAVAATSDGFMLAEKDLEIRGEGQLFGQRQSGMPDLKLARVRRDVELVAKTRQLAKAILREDPDLSAPAQASLRAEVQRRYEGGIEAFEALATG